MFTEVVDERFENLERLIRRELDDIKQTLNSLRSECVTQNVIDHPPSFIVDPRQEEIDRLNNTVQTINTPTGVLMFLFLFHSNVASIISVTLPGVKKTFVYFMRVNEFDKKMSRWESKRSERSPTLYLPQSRYAMYVRVTPRDDQGRVVYANVGVGLTRGIHDETLQWPFSLKHRVEVRPFNHSTPLFLPFKKTPSDIFSRFLYFPIA